MSASIDEDRANVRHFFRGGLPAIEVGNEPYVQVVPALALPAEKARWWAERGSSLGISGQRRRM